MSSKNGSTRLQKDVDRIYPLYQGHYVPHARVSERNEIVNPITGEISNPPSMTKQEFVKQCDINNIIKEFSLTGQISHINAQAAQGRFLDLPDNIDFQQSVHLVQHAQAAFAALPAAIRNRFHGNPAEFLAFVQDPANAAELIELGIRERPPRNTTPTGADQVPASPPAPGGSEQNPGGQAS